MIHLHPTAPVAERALLPGDPGRALRLAQALLEAPKMFNHNRGLWGYTGTAADGQPLTIQSTGMGGPSAAIVISELAELGVRQMVRVGTCGALHAELELGQLIVAAEAIAADGTSRALGAGARVAGSSELLAPLADHPQATVVSSDLFYEERPGVEAQWLAAGAQAVEMEVAVLYALAARRGFAAAALLLVSDVIRPQRRRIDPAELPGAETRLGQAAMAAVRVGAPAGSG